MVAGLAGVGVGFVLAGIASQSTSTTTTVSQITTTRALSGMTGTTNTTEGPSPTITGGATITTSPSTTRTPVEPPPTLSEMVPGFQGVLRYTLGQPDQQMVRWAGSAAASSVVKLPAGADGARWDASGGWVASTTRSTYGDALYLGTPSNLRPALIGIGGFAWHDTDPGTIMFYEVIQTAERTLLTVKIHIGEVTNLGLSSSELVTIDTPFAVLGTAVWGDWGFAMAGRDANGLLLATTLDTEGGQLSTLNDTFVIDHTSTGTLLLVEAAEEDPETGVTFRLLLADASGTDIREAPWTLSSPAKFSHSGEFLVSTEDAPGGTTIRFDSDEVSFEARTSAQDPVILGWTPDDRFAVLWTSLIRHRDGFGPALLFVDILDRSLNAVPVDEVVSSVAFEE